MDFLIEDVRAYSSALVHSVPSWLIWAEIEFKVHVALTKSPINQFKSA